NQGSHPQEMDHRGAKSSKEGGGPRLGRPSAAAHARCTSSAALLDPPRKAICAKHGTGLQRQRKRRTWARIRARTKIEHLLLTYPAPDPVFIVQQAGDERCTISDRPWRAE